MSRYKRHNYNHETGAAEVRIIDSKRGIHAVGRAKVHEDDLAFSAEFTGLNIAEVKAQIKFYKQRAKSKQDEALRLEKQASFLVDSAFDDLTKQKAAIDYLAYYIESKDRMYRSVEKMRARKAEGEDPIDTVSFTDLGDLTVFMTDEQKAQAEKEIKEGETDNAK